ncbi:hypothetical protein GCM10018780_23780 [Streptomyces lanatus]|nr:hypothetical protein GCM10018780_23780 [Streptomyces lanatus]
MKAALLAALAEGAGGDDGLRAVESLARALGLGAGASVAELADAARDPARRAVVQRWGEELAGLLAADPEGVARGLAGAMQREAPGSGASWYDGDHADFRGGVFLREVVGVQVVIQGGGVAVPEALTGLPPRPGGFTGRAEETAALLAALDPAGAAQSSAVLVAAVTGLGGIGKTALAVETAHLACERGLFPGGVLFIDLHGYDQEPVAADHALQALLRALGIAPGHIPNTADERAVLYRSTLAARARERGAVLVLADNASSPDQVRLLLPADNRHRVLVTSRDRLPQLGARLVRLDQLSPKEAYELLDRALRIADPDDSRVGDDPDMAERLARLCGHLPLALQIAAALLAEDPDMPVAELVAELGESRDRLEYLDDGERSVRAAFELSYRRLPSEQARLLRLLALAPGAEVSDQVVAALVGAEVPPARELKALARAHLLERGSGRGRWRLHDLVRAFGARVVAGDAALREEGDVARTRVFAFYGLGTIAAHAWLSWLPGKSQPQLFADRAQAVAWLDDERAGMVAAILWGLEERYADSAAGLAELLTPYLAWRRHFDDLITVNRATREVAHRAGNRPGEARALLSLGGALMQTGRLREASEALISARDLYQAVGDHHGEAAAWDNLGFILQEAGMVDEAISAHVYARDLFRALKDRRGEAKAWDNLGCSLDEAGRPEEAIEALINARGLYRAVGDRQGEAAAWGNLGVALAAAGRAEEAIDSYGKALKVLHEFENWFEAGRMLRNLAAAQTDLQRLADARTSYLRAADAFTRAGSPAQASAALTAADAPEPTDKPTPASPPAHKPAPAQPSPPPPNAPDTAEP